jgi:hypothetical protein
VKNEAQIIALSDSYRKQLLLAVEEKTGSPIADPALDLLILSLIDKLETLDWVLEQNGEDNTTGYVYGNNLSH